MTSWKKLEVERLEPNESGVVVFRLTGLLTNSTESYAFLDCVREDLHHEHNRIVINLEKVEVITSAGVGILAACFTSITNAGGRLVLSCISSRVRTLLNVVRLLDLLQTCPSEEEALREAGK